MVPTIPEQMTHLTSPFYYFLQWMPRAIVPTQQPRTKAYPISASFTPLSSWSKSTIHTLVLLTRNLQENYVLSQCCIWIMNKNRKCMVSNRIWYFSIGKTITSRPKRKECFKNEILEPSRMRDTIGSL